MENEGTIARNVRLRMKARGLGQKALSLKADLNETYVRDILKGKSRNPRQEHLQKLALALECRVSDLTGELDATGNDGTPKSLLRQQLLAAFDDLTDQRDWEMAVRVIRSVKHDAPPVTPVTPEPAGADPPPPFQEGGNVKENRVSPPLLTLVQSPCPVVEA
jgi:transcriptional regulator with XRE-family HTH domain